MNVHGHRTRFRIFAEDPNGRVLLTVEGRRDLVLTIDPDVEAAKPSDVAHWVAAALHWEQPNSEIEIVGCDCGGDHLWDIASDWGYVL